MYQSQERPQTSSGYKDQLRAQLRDNYVQNRSERSSKASQSGASSRQEAAHYPVDAVSQHSASSHRQRHTAGPQITRDTPAPARSTHGGASQQGTKTPQQATWGNPNQRTATPQAEAQSQRSLHTNSTTLTNAELVCDNCINRTIADERKSASKHERLLDQQIQNELIAKERALREKEEADEARRKEQFRQEATAHWEDSKRAKQLQKEGHTAAERDQERAAQEQYLRDLKDFQELERQRREQAEAARKDHYKTEIERFKAERDAKKQQQLLEKQRELEAYAANQAKLAAEEAERQAAIKAREGLHSSALKTQINEHAERKKAEEEERKKYKIALLKHEAVCKLYDCCQCHNKYPPAKLNKVKHANGI